MLRGLIPWLSLAAASKCDTMYTRPGISTLVADGSCPASVACLLDAQCKPIQSFPNATTAFSDPPGVSNSSIGDLSKYPHPTLKLYNLRYGNAFDRIEFPPTLQNLTMQHLTLYSLGNLQLPAGLKNWTMFTCYVSKITTSGFQWPQSLETLNLNENILNDVPANIPRSVKYLDLSFNNISVVVDHDWRSLRYLYLSGIQTFAHVRLSTNLTYFGCLVTNLTLDEATYRVLNALGPNNATAKTGVYVGSATANASTCAGRIFPIWQGAVENATACVVPTITSPPPTTLVPTVDGSSGSSGLLVAVLVVSAVAVLSSLVLVLYWRRRRLQHSFSIEESTTSTIDLSSLQMHKLDRSELVILGDKPLAAGGFGEVWKGTYANEVVAIKRNKDKLEKGLQSFIAEITLMAKMDSPYIVRLVGASWIRPIDIECVVEFMDLGDLRCFLADRSMTQFTWREKAPVVQSIVLGLIFLHTFDPPIIHRDLKSRNILLDSVKGTKLTDFGISREVDESTMTNGIGTYQWMAPEVISGTSYSEAADIYSFGVVLSELSTHTIPYLGLTNSATGRSATPQFVMTKVLAGEMTPAFNATSPSWVQEIGLRCMALDPDERPTALQLYVSLRPLLDSLTQPAKATSA
ncbi:TKL protein kinase, variant 1 [Saprolegnia diclina VS20]|uniref:TKL protein kinase, variant 1 n=1 Tax=Saprolegnia diclina (strain VS20) TaxID=1156394 RepID=T0R0L9_SAPDV|nr:TKL protein kinase, variant 1 [Saprolegnia diclina VS20]EQC25513.1 TKL protein kinase, variant 1 [Saprolegnia diclina VS20]|eukprot:XP_008621057.1 TKL protein kinase, variant 1 [Saprolegnia diclina VS20]